MNDESVLVTVASIISGFGATVLVFRVQREAAMHRTQERTWIPWADWLVVSATLLALCLGVFPAISGLFDEGTSRMLSVSSNSAAVVLLAGYTLAILAHYRLIFGGGRTGARANPEPAEAWITVLAALAAALVFGLTSCRALHAVS